ncbi:hypothetical protein Pelo_17142 [Pelomyxa schiedti]|nr:hypothetical protein Pelo_17142 [Pelomyxa schiedti]
MLLPMLHCLQFERGNNTKLDKAVVTVLVDVVHPPNGSVGDDDLDVPAGSAVDPPRLCVIGWLDRAIGAKSCALPLPQMPWWHLSWDLGQSCVAHTVILEHVTLQNSGVLVLAPKQGCRHHLDRGHTLLALNMPASIGTPKLHVFATLSAPINHSMHIFTTSTLPLTKRSSCVSSASLQAAKAQVVDDNHFTI